MYALAGAVDGMLVLSVLLCPVPANCQSCLRGASFDALTGSKVGLWASDY